MAAAIPLRFGRYCGAGRSAADRTRQITILNQLEQILPTIFTKLPLEVSQKLKFAYELLLALSAGNEIELMQLLQDLTVVLNIGNFPINFVLKVPILWISARRRLPNDARMTTFCRYVLKQLTQEELPSLLEETERVFEQEDASYETALVLINLCIKHTQMISKNTLRSG